MRTLRLVIVASLTAVIASCGSSTGPTYTGGGGGGGGGVTCNSTGVVCAVDDASATPNPFAFSPTTLTITAGSAVTWKNTTGTLHTVTFSTTGAPPGISSLGAGTTGSITFSNAGTYDYHCSIHPNMTGTIVVQ